MCLGRTLSKARFCCRMRSGWGQVRDGGGPTGLAFGIFCACPLADHYPVSDIALCSVVLAWSHVALAVVGSTALVVFLQSWQGRALGGDQQLGVGDFASRSTVSGLRLAWQPCSMRDAVMYALCALQCLWCVLRVVYIKMN